VTADYGVARRGVHRSGAAAHDRSLAPPWTGRHREDLGAAYVEPQRRDHAADRFDSPERPLPVRSGGFGDTVTVPAAFAVAGR